ncbi:helix-turn-helix transcriptional regulator [Nocardioides antri]|uniref:Helix-turn-helix transcriptional regulator n=1 Tax=Nocardioides antri TaxID=2607659 RepID=A0A5B1LX77_9ACTN|nr:helix-turn-helix transcriptional regulator [Nocardioides antri]
MARDSRADPHHPRGRGGRRGRHVRGAALARRVGAVLRQPRGPPQGAPCPLEPHVRGPARRPHRRGRPPRHLRPAAAHPGRRARHPPQGERGSVRCRRPGVRPDRRLAGPDPAPEPQVPRRPDPAVTTVAIDARAPGSARRLDRLSRRELEVLRLIAEGLSNAAIAAELYLAAKTVETVCGNIFRKLELYPSDDVNRRVLAVLVLLRETRLS